MSDVELTHDDLVGRAKTFLTNDLNCGFALVEFHTSALSMYGIPDALGFIRRGRCSVLIECKVSRSDFFRDQKKPCRQISSAGLGNVKYYMVPHGLVEPQEVPEGWGLIETYEHSGRVAAKRTHGYRGQIRQSAIEESGYWHESAKGAERQMMYSALRRLEKRGHLDSIYDKPWEHDE